MFTVAERVGAEAVATVTESTISLAAIALVMLGSHSPALATLCLALGATVGLAVRARGVEVHFHEMHRRLHTTGKEDAVQTQARLFDFLGLKRVFFRCCRVGANRLEVAVTSAAVAMPVFATHAFAIVPGAPKQR